MELSAMAVSVTGSLSNEELILRFQQGEQEAFTILVGRFKDSLTNFVYRFVGDLDVANDLVQETFIRLYQRRDSYNHIAKFSNWLYTIASNLAKSELRRTARTRNTSIYGMFSKDGDDDESGWEIPDTAPTPDARVDTTLKMQLIQQALMKISPAYREIVILRDVQDLGYKEIAEITGLELGTVKSRINRGRTQLQELLKDIYHDMAPDSAS